MVKAKRAGGLTQVIEPLLSKYKALSSNPITAKIESQNYVVERSTHPMCLSFMFLQTWLKMASEKGHIVWKQGALSFHEQDCGGSFCWDSRPALACVLHMLCESPQAASYPAVALSVKCFTRLSPKCFGRSIIFRFWHNSEERLFQLLLMEHYTPLWELSAWIKRVMNDINSQPGNHESVLGARWFF
jgi:hypothetical protein